MLKETIEDFFNNEDKVRKYRQGLGLMKEAGFFDLLRKLGYPNIIDSGNNPNAMAVEAAISHGYQRAVTYTEFFFEMYGLKKQDAPLVPTFGAEKYLLKEKLMTKDEINKVKGER